MRKAMELTSIRNLFRDQEKYLNQTVTVGGWIRSVRDSKTFGFLVVNDGTFFEPLQVVYADKLENFAAISKLNVGAAVIVTGKLVATPNAKQPFEIQADEVVVEGEELLARAICHELDHLDGHMYTEKVEGSIHDVTYEEEE